MSVEEMEDKVWVTMAATVNFGNYENIKIDMGQSRTVGPDDDPDELRMEIARKILSDVVDMIDEVKPGGALKPSSGRKTETDNPPRRRTRQGG